MPATAHSERWESKAVDWVEARSEIDTARIGMTGISLGGHFVPRAVAVKPRFASGAVWGANHNWAEVNGTHLDAPWHFHPTMDGGQRAITIDEVPLDWCFLPGVKLDFTALPNGHVVTGAEVEAELARIPR